MIKIIRGNIFTTDCQSIVNTVNCVGVMGAGIAYEFRLRYPEMYEKYQELCKNNMLDIGKLWIYKKNENKWIINFPTKYHWKYPSKIEYLEKGLKKFVSTYEDKGIVSVAFPILGATNGGIPQEKSIQIMEKYLSNINILVEIYFYDKNAKDDLYNKFQEFFSMMNDSEISKESHIRIDIVRKIRMSLSHNDINSTSGLLNVKGIGEKTLERLFHFMQSRIKL